jgi:formate hydrogenlyase subunit 3/multisubunit Na+/H+ antiporter MnhD subunit
MDSLLLTIVIPALAGLIILAVPARLWWLRSVFGVLGVLATFVAAGTLVGETGTWSRPWMQLGGGEVRFALRADALSHWAAAFAALLSLVTVFYVTGWYRGRGAAGGRIHAWLLLATAGTLGVLLADDLLVLVVSWEVVTLMLFVLATTGRPEGAAGAAKAFAILGLGDMALLVAAVLLGTTHSWSLSELAADPLPTTGALNITVFGLLLVAALAKAGAMPLHSWIPTLSTGTHASVMALLPGALDKLLGITLLARLVLDWFVPTGGAQFVIMLVGVITILGAVFMAMVQHDLRRLLSFHAVSQVGYMLLGLGTGTLIGVMGGLFHMLNHAIYKACLFLGAGSIEREAGTMELSRLGGLGRTMPVTFGAMLVAALAISGIPPLNGFVSKWMIYQSCLAADQPLFLVAAIFGSALTLASFVKVLHSAFWGPRPSRLDEAREGSAGIGVPIALVTLSLLCVGLGVAASLPLDSFFGPVVGLAPDAAVSGAAALDGTRVTWTAVGESVAAATESGGGLQPLGLTLLLTAGVTAALLLAFLGGFRSRRTRPVFVGGQEFDREVNRFSGTEFYRTVAELPGLGAALRTGESGRLDPYPLTGRLGQPVIRALKRLHSGLVDDYLAWCFGGLAIVLLVIFGS